MRYLITTTTDKPFKTEWYDYENFFNAEIGMIVYDLIKNKYTTDGKTWKRIQIDHLWKQLHRKK